MIASSLKQHGYTHSEIRFCSSVHEDSIGEQNRRSKCRLQRDEGEDHNLQSTTV